MPRKKRIGKAVYGFSTYLTQNIRERIWKLNDKGIKNPSIIKAGVEKLEKEQ